MPPIIRFTREAVLEAACHLVRRDGASAINARAVARELGGSTQPIFRLFSGMDELHDAIIQHASDAFYADMQRQMEASDKPYLAMSMHYVTFARKEPEMFKFLFMRDRVSNGCYKREREDYEALYANLSQTLNITRDQAEAFYARTWVFTHGLAVSIATKYMPCLQESEIRTLLLESCLAAAQQLNLTLPEN